MQDNKMAMAAMTAFTTGVEGRIGRGLRDALALTGAATLMNVIGVSWLLPAESLQPVAAIFGLDAVEQADNLRRFALGTLLEGSVGFASLVAATSFLIRSGITTTRGMLAARRMEVPHG